ncbi:cell wall metabolism sensor histidine kinase WalK [Nocardia sp. SYP-A9097]|uniref:sensor histidine kinase n=1 Tax=Nocardia sp. SYP-A9097 TaxID=2663237 RepID=UPI001E532C54|nr:HAMP domain-containing sensor histidine kinase [Nocardia sp. SYP-A9097]
MRSAERGSPADPNGYRTPPGSRAESLRGRVVFAFALTTALVGSVAYLAGRDGPPDSAWLVIAAGAAIFGAAVGVWATRRLSTTVEDFNTMVDSLQRRVDRERRLVGDVSHELRTPLTTLITSVGVLNRHSRELPERSRRALEFVSAELEHLRHILDDMLELARVEAGVHRGDTESLSAAELLTHMLADRSYAQELLRVTGEVLVTGRKLELERAIGNLLDNANRHGGGVLAVSAVRAGPEVVITVDDAGPGVPAAERERIFERFATVRNARRSASGTGIGLALVAETVAAHRGRVECVERPGGGARFSVRLPSAAA